MAVAKKGKDEVQEEISIIECVNGYIILQNLQRCCVSYINEIPIGVFYGGFVLILYLLSLATSRL